jgi:hypothetical protein
MDVKEENGSKSALKRKRIPGNLRNFDKIADKKTLLKSLSIEDLKLYEAYQMELRRDTQNELTDTEYETFAMMRLYLHTFYLWAQDKEPDEIPTDLQSLTHRYEKAVTFAMRDYRQKGARGDWDLRGLKEAVINMKAKDGGEFLFEYKKKEPEKIIKVVVDDNEGND